MDIHRCRFVPYPPSAINAVAFSHPYVAGVQKSALVRLAVGRANGDIEIWNPLKGQWHQEIILHGGKDRSIDGLVWVNEPDQVLQDGTKMIGRSRLFSIGYTSTITEWDLEKGRPKKQASGIHGDIWCLAAQPLVDPSKSRDKTQANRVAQTGKKLVAGTIDGSLVLYSIDDDDLQFDRVLVKSSSKKTRMVSMTFQNRNVVVVGCSDSAIRVYDMRNGNMLSKMTLGSDLAGGAREIIVWSVKCLNGRDIVSGDSTGQVCIFDGKTYTQAQRLQSHKQDVLSLATSADGSTIVSGGMDRKTVLYRRTRGSTSRWGKVWHRRYHSHDVKTMASFEGLGMSVVVSGGPDASPIVLPLQEAGMENHRTLPCLPQDPPLRSAAKARLIVSWWEREVHIWRLRQPLNDLVNVSDGESAVAKNRKLLARILIKGEANITSAAISDDGSLLVVSTSSDIKAFHLKSRGDARKEELRISKVEVPEAAAAQGATRIQVSPDGKWLCLVQEGSKVCAFQLVQDSYSESKPAIHPKAIRLQRIGRKLPKHIALGGLGQYERTVSHISFSPDSRMLAVADLAGYIDTWVLRDSTQRLQDDIDDSENESASDASGSDNENDGSGIPSDGVRWVRNPNGALIPRLHAAPTVLSFSNHIPDTTIRPQGVRDQEHPDDYILLAITAKPQILLLNPGVGSITAWSRRNPLSRFPVEFRNIRDLVKGALWEGDRVWLYGNNFLVMLDLTKDIVEAGPEGKPSSAMVSANGQRGKKRKRGPDTGAGNKMGVGALGPTKVVRHVRGQTDEELSLDAPAAAGPDPMDTDATSGPGEEESDSEDSEDERRGELALLRGAQGRKRESEGAGDIAFWCTYKYRPILGIVPLLACCDRPAEEGAGRVAGNGDTDIAYVNGNGEQPRRRMLEVAIVERPLWEVDMPDRYFADGEYDR
ncbi:hypothetical protein DL766_004196 [Monosporascus sp. MC13-8B]|uniref:Anaphase-promoting complex subunit 4 WD40 domain-containing protein n=1 Tax=Monosporascus cannonballus TaxID=155416 RepID=A0ABY0HJV9_9PEZI|nr:hypothetical protein DL762_000207 [Monosporascus cannonballus]RYP01478.1 hypothetical protein DL763_000141 [Monosporascus cannonballus]RYP31911.1 hypothetical protein DL766_004196 [Monosporascus sp. MC13-8B]